MKIFSVSQIKEWERYSKNTQNISETDLIERAATACFQWLDKEKLLTRQFYIFCGKGNNGNDGLALGHILEKTGCSVSIIKINSDNIQSAIENFSHLNADDIIIDALFGTGLSRNLEGDFVWLTEKINTHKNVISIDIASGLFADEPTSGVAVKPAVTLTFESYKLAFLRPENESYTGKIHILNIGLNKEFYDSEPAKYSITEFGEMKDILRPRKSFSNKGNFGYAALFCGSKGMMGAAVLSTEGCLSVGPGKITTHVPEVGYTIIQSSAPEAMCVTSGENFISETGNLSKYTAIGLGCGIGINNDNKWLENILNYNVPLIIDADALNRIAQLKWQNKIPQGSIITPHPGEFKRLFQTEASIEAAMKKAEELGIYILLKGNFTLIACPDGFGYFNPTGNSGMAKGGMGDVLTGIITGLRAQGYDALQSCRLGAFLHGLSGDICAKEYSQEFMQARDVIKCMYKAWNTVKGS